MVSSIDASHHDAGAAYFATTRYQHGDYRPYLYRTHDYGETWRQVTGGISDVDFTRVMREDPARQGLLYAGTEGGVYVSLDDGESWSRLQTNLPAGPDSRHGGQGRRPRSRHPRAGVLGPGRRDPPSRDVQPGEGLRRAPVQAKGHPPLPGRAEPVRDTGAGARPSSTGSPSGCRRPSTPTPRRRVRRCDVTWTAGANPPDGVVVTYYLREQPEGEVRLVFLDDRGSEIAIASSEPEDPNEVRLSTRQGANRYVWDMRYPKGPEAPRRQDRGAPVQGPPRAARRVPGADRGRRRGADADVPHHEGPAGHRHGRRTCTSSSRR